MRNQPKTVHALQKIFLRRRENGAEPIFNCFSEKSRHHCHSNFESSDFNGVFTGHNRKGRSRAGKCSVVVLPYLPGGCASLPFSETDSAIPLKGRFSNYPIAIQQSSLHTGVSLTYPTNENIYVSPDEAWKPLPSTIEKGLLSFGRSTTIFRMTSV